MRSSASAEGGGGLKAALAHGYKRLVSGRKHCSNCGYGSPENENGYVHCRMFEFAAQARARCDEWAPERSDRSPDKSPPL